MRNFGEYTDAVAQEAEDRERGHIRNTKDYLALRRVTIGVRPSFDFFLLSEDLPDSVLAHPHIERLVICGTDLILLENVSDHVRGMKGGRFIDFYTAGYLLI